MHAFGCSKGRPGAGDITGDVGNVWYLVECPLHELLVGRTVRPDLIEPDVFRRHPLGGVGERTGADDLDTFGKARGSESPNFAGKSGDVIARAGDHRDGILFIARGGLGRDEDTATRPA